jgi:hypothetical protein
VGSGDGARGGAVPLMMAEDFLDSQKRVLIAKGTPVVGFIEDSKAEGAWGRAGKLTFTIEETTAVDGTKVKLSGKIQRRGRNNEALLGWNLFARGSNVKLKKGWKCTAMIDADVSMDPTRTGANAPADAAKSTAPTDTSAVPASPPSGKLYVLTLSNGDKITGSVDGPQNGFYTVTTKAGPLRIAQADVAGMVEKVAPATAKAPSPLSPTTRPIGRSVVIHLKSGGEVSGRVESFKDGTYTVSVGGGTYQVAESDIASIEAKT